MPVPRHATIPQMGQDFLAENAYHKDCEEKGLCSGLGDSTAIHADSHGFYG
jgi:hypothetical protein